MNKIIKIVCIYILILGLQLASGMIANKAISTITEEFPVSDRRCVIIDPGHGGVDGGATSCTGVLESRINLQVAQRLNCLLQLLGIKTYMIRTEDISVHTEGTTIAAQKVSDLKERVRICNQIPNALLISIHQNYYQDDRYSGAQVFYGPSGNSVDLAVQMQSSLVRYLKPGSHRKAQKAEGIYLLEHISCSGILIECGFLSNPEEEYKLRNTEYQKDLCCVIASTICQYLSNT